MSNSLPIRVGDVQTPWSSNQEFKIAFSHKIYHNRSFFRISNGRKIQRILNFKTARKRDEMKELISFSHGYGQLMGHIVLIPYKEKEDI
jgi:hypothetical protein